MPTLTAAIDVDPGQAAAFERAARFFSMDLQAFLDAALASGLAHGESLGTSELMDDEEIGLDDAPEPDFTAPEPPPDFLPAMAAAFDALHRNVIIPLIDKTQNLAEDAQVKGETVRMTIVLPKEWMILAAWLEIHGVKRREGDLSPMPNAINTDARLAHWWRAKHYIWRALNDHFHDELHFLATHGHPYLYRPKARPPLTRAAPNGQGEGIDDDIPF